jgi:hypothetical protein
MNWCKYCNVVDYSDIIIIGFKKQILILSENCYIYNDRRKQ